MVFYVDGVEAKAGEPEAQETEGQGRRRFVLRYYSVFNTEQCELPAATAGKLALPEERQLDPIEACEKILAGMPNPPEIQHAGDKAFYSPATDRITLPPRGLFESAEEYWATLWHECGGHATGHPKRAQPRLDQRSGAVRIGNIQHRRMHRGDGRRLSVRDRRHREPRALPVLTPRGVPAPR